MILSILGLLSLNGLQTTLRILGQTREEIPGMIATLPDSRGEKYLRALHTTLEDSQRDEQRFRQQSLSTDIPIMTGKVVWKAGVTALWEQCRTVSLQGEKNMYLHNHFPWPNQWIPFLKKIYESLFWYRSACGRNTLNPPGEINFKYD